MSSVGSPAASTSASSAHSGGRQLRREERREDQAFQRYLKRSALHSSALATAADGLPGGPRGGPVEEAAPEEAPEGSVVLDLDRLRAGIARDADECVAEAAPAHEEDIAQQLRFSVLKNAGLRRIFLRCALLGLLACAYYAYLILATRDAMGTLETNALRLELGLRRFPLLALSFIFTREHLLRDFDQSVADLPSDPLVQSGPFALRAAADLDHAERLAHGVLFGDAAAGIPPPSRNPRYERVMYGNVCAMTRADVASLDIEVPESFWDTCASFDGGALSQGLYATLAQVFQDLRALQAPQYSAALGLFLGSTDPVAVETRAFALARLQYLDAVLHDFLLPPLRFTAEVAKEDSLAAVDDFEALRLVLLCVFVILNAAAYFLIVLPLLHLMRETAARSHAMLLLLPPAIAKASAGVQQYVADSEQ
jgi:hypothetical protein